MKLVRYGNDEHGTILVEPDDHEELVPIDLDDAECTEPRSIGWRIVDQYGKPMGGNQ